VSGPSSLTANGGASGFTGASLVPVFEGSPVGEPQAASDPQARTSSSPATARPSGLQRSSEAIMTQTVRGSANADPPGLAAYSWPT